MPFERQDAGDGYGGTGPVTTRQMTPEERAKYGPPEYLDWMFTEKQIRHWVGKAPSLQQAARRLRTSPEKLIREIKRFGMDVPEKWEVDSMTEDHYLEGAVPEEGGRKEKLLQVLDKDKFLGFKAQGLSNTKILEKLGLPKHWQDALSIISRKEWGYDGSKSSSGEAVRLLTVSQALKEREELAEDIDDLSRLRKETCSSRISEMLKDREGEYRDTLEKINAALEITKIAL